MGKKLKVGIVGASGWMAGALSAGVEYDEKGFDFESKKGSKSEISYVSALCDLNAEAMAKRKEDIGLSKAESFTSYDKMLESPEVEAVIIAVPNNLHSSFAIKALAAGKHVFLEKPFATSREDSLKLMKAASSSKFTTKVDYILMHYDEQENLRALVRDGAFGEIASTHYTYRHPIQASQSPEQIWKLSRAKTGGAMPMGTCHAISLTVFQVDSDPVSVVCKSSKAKVRPFDYDTQHDMIVVFKNGVVSIIQGNIDFAEKYDARHSIVGVEGQFDYYPFNPSESKVMWSSKKLGRPYSADPKFANDHLDSGDVWKHKCSKTVREFVKKALKKEKDNLMGLESQNVKRIEAIVWAAEKSASMNGAMISASDYLQSI